MKTSILSIFFLLTFSFTTFAQKEVLVILSEETKLELRDGKSFKTGNYLNELMIPLLGMVDQRLEPVFATPTGKMPNLDQDSIDIKYFNNDKKRFDRALKYFKSIGEGRSIAKISDLLNLDWKKIAVVFVPGGHAPMIDLVKHPPLGDVLKKAHALKVTTALICHGPIAILSAKSKDEWIYKGYNMTIFSNAEEKVAEENKLKGKVMFYPEDALRSAGGKVKVAKEWSSHVVVDRELITAQNPNSVDAFTEKILQKIK